MSPIGSIFWGFRRHILVISVIFMLNFCNSVTFCTFFHVKISKVHYLSLKFLVISKVPFLSLFSQKRCGTPDLGLWHTSVPWHTGWQPMGYTNPKLTRLKKFSLKGLAKSLKNKMLTSTKNN